MPERNTFRRDESAYYRICFLGVLDASWSPMFGDMMLTTERFGDKQCVTTLTGYVADQAALMGVLNLAYDLSMVLIAVEREPALTNGPAYR